MTELEQQKYAEALARAEQGLNEIHRKEAAAAEYMKGDRWDTENNLTYIGMKINNICKRAVEKFGPGRQQKKAIEEMAELTVALIQYGDMRVDKQAVITEIVDVRIMLEQLMYMFEDDTIELEYQRKLARLEANIKELHSFDEQNDKYVLAEAECLGFLSSQTRDELMSRLTLPESKNKLERMYRSFRNEAFND